MRCSSCDSILGMSIEIAAPTMTLLIQDLTEKSPQSLNSG